MGAVLVRYSGTRFGSSTCVGNFANFVVPNSHSITTLALGTWQRNSRREDAAISGRQFAQDSRRTVSSVGRCNQIGFVHGWSLEKCSQHRVLILSQLQLVATIDAITATAVLDDRILRIFAILLGVVLPACHETWKQLLVEFIRSIVRHSIKNEVL